MGDSATQRVFRFGVFEVDSEQRVVHRNGQKIRLQDQPFDVLCQLIERPGKIVTREELRKKLWSNDTFVDFDQGLNTAIAKIREALGDSAGDARYVETVPRRGYRFIAPVEGPPPAALDGRGGAAVEAAGLKRFSRHERRWLTRESVLLASAAAVAAAALAFWLQPAGPVAEAPVRQFSYAPADIAFNPYHSGPLISPNSKHIIYMAGKGEEQKLWIQDLDRPDPRPVEGSGSGQAPFWSPGSDLIGFYAAQEVRKAPVQGGRSSLVCKTPSPWFLGGSWSPEGDRIVFATGLPSRLYEVSA